MFAAFTMPQNIAAEDAYFKFGPMELTLPLKTVDAAYLYDFRHGQSLVGADTPLITLWDKVSGVAGVVTTLQSQGSPYVGADLKFGQTLDKLTDIGPVKFGGWYSYNFRNKESIGGLKCSVKLWE